MDQRQARERIRAERFARLATVRPDGAPHVVPITFALLDGDQVVTAVDHKPKSTQRLQRLTNLGHDPRCAVLWDHAEADWTQLWWVRGDGDAEVVADPAPDHPGLAALAESHPQYRHRRPAGPLIVITIGRWSGWAYTDR